MPKSNDDEFFETRKDWSRRKHLILDQYLHPAIARMRKATRDGKVFVLDGFAGQGRYDDGSPGSPLHTGKLADIVRNWADPVDIRIHNIEADKQNHFSLQVNTETWVKQGVVVNHNATYKEALPAVLNDMGESPLLAFLDPFRPVELPFEDIVPLVTRKGKTEIFIVFHTPAILRIISAVRPSAKTIASAKVTLTQTLDTIFGVADWRQFLEQEPTTDAVVECFMAGLSAHSLKNCGKRNDLFLCAHAIQVRVGVGLKYHVIFATRHSAAILIINNAFAKERFDLYIQSVTHANAATLFEGTDEDLMSADEIAKRPKRVQQTIIDACKAHPTATWFFQDLLLASMLHQFGMFSEKEYRQAFGVLLDITDSPKLDCVNGTRLLSGKRMGKWKIEDGLQVKFVS